MKTIITVLCLFCSTNLLAQVPGPFVPDSNTVGLWHLDETTGLLLQDASFYHNNAQAIGTTVVPGAFGNARYFNGTSDYAYVTDPANGSLDFGVNQSFTLEGWFKTTSLANQRILRKGLAPIPGYEMGLNEGKVFGIIGNRQDGTPPDTLLVVKSNALYNNNVWHHAVFIRDRFVRKLFLYVDEILAATPIDDNFPYSLANDQPLGIGRWFGSSLPLFFQGTIDEVRISNTTRHPVNITSDTVGLWHFDETAGSTLFDSSPNHNNGTAYGASIVGGIIDNARYFNGTGNYATMPSNPAYNFQSSESFTVSAWVKTSGAEGIILRRGLDPIPGFQLSIHFGRAIGRIGNTRGNSWSDTLLTLTSTQLINDNVWHEIRMVRDRSQAKLFLYIDGISAATPQDDYFTVPLTNDRQLTLGASLILPDYFTGPIDEVGIFRGARHPVTTTSDTVALYHYDEAGGTNVYDSSPYANHGTAYGTTIVSGRFGNARSFSGSNSYVFVPNPVNGSLNFPSSQSFTVQVWFKTTQLDTGEMIRRGLAPTPGFALRILDGHVQGVVGDTPIDQNLIRITSTRADYNDGQWHLATLIRDRSVAKVFLYVDGVQAASPLNDNLVNPISNDRPLTMGCWETFVRPTFYRGVLDEVGIFKGARHPVTVTSDTLGLWPLDETSGPNVIDSSPYLNNGTAIGTTIIPGRFGNARNFNGSNNYVQIPNPINGIYNFANSQSFTIRAWVKTSGTEGIIVRRGLVPYPGFQLSIHFGRAIGIIGNYQGPNWNDTLLTLTSGQLINDNVWHEITMVRDRNLARLFLYVDSVSAATPQNDNFIIPLFNDRPFTFGAWEIQQNYFTGAIDEVAIFRGARHPVIAPSIEVSPTQVSFGSVLIGTNSLQQVFVSNVGIRDTLYIGTSTNNPVFQATIPITYPIPPGGSRNVPVFYTPTAVRVDTGTLSISSNDPNRPIVRVPLSGQGFTVTAAPFITSIKDIPEDQGKQVRVIWYRSVHDSSGDSLRIVQYNLWRRVGMNNNLWDFIATIPAVRFQQYAYVAPTLFDSSRAFGIRWSVFRVSAHTANGAQVYFSAADSGYSVDNLPPSAPTNLVGGFIAGRVSLGWDAPPDPDIELFVVYRATTPNFIPSPENQIGTTPTTSFVDQSIGGNPAYYYCVAAFDTAGNQGAFSNQIRVLTTGVNGGNNLPTDFALYQNYPNPFNPSSTIAYDVPSNSYVTIKVYDLLGKEVATLVDQARPAGHYEVQWSAESRASGIYIYRMLAGTYSAIKKMILIK